jgi:single-stranded-DNA-specific exonuclease
MPLERDPQAPVAQGADAAVQGALDPLFNRQGEEWEIAPELALAELDAVPGCSRLLVQLLSNRGINGVQAVRTFLAGDWRAEDEALPDLGVAVQRIVAAMQAKERIIVFGDFDCDGLTSCALLASALRALGAEVEAYVPRRDDDGRGLNVAAVRELASKHVGLVITTDCGTANVAEVELAVALGMDVIVTDHHPVHGQVAPALALVNPQRAENGTHSQLAGVGVAFRLAEALCRAAADTSAGRDERRCSDLLDSLLDLVAVGTVADLVPLSTENWALVRAGMRRLNAAPRPGLRALVARSQLPHGSLVPRDISFGLAPRLNAASRLGEPQLALRLLMTEDAAEAEHLAQALDALNQTRQDLTELIVAAAREQVLGYADGSKEPGSEGSGHAWVNLPSVLIAQGEDWPLGILGLAAGRLAEEYQRAVIVISTSEDECRGSARAPEGYNLGAVLAERADLFRRFGGHAQAAGFTVARSDLNALLAYVREALATTDDGRLEQAQSRGRSARIGIDCRLPLGRLDTRKFEDIAQLEPCGPGFPEPVFLATGLRILRCWRSGRDGRNLRLVLRDGSGQHSVLWSKHGAHFDLVRKALPGLPPLDVAYSVAPYYRAGAAEPEWTIRVTSIRPTPTAHV